MATSQDQYPSGSCFLTSAEKQIVFDKYLIVIPKKKYVEYLQHFISSQYPREKSHQTTSKNLSTGQTNANLKRSFYEKSLTLGILLFFRGLTHLKINASSALISVLHYKQQ